jgi:hypothetical protein
MSLISPLFRFRLLASKVQLGLPLFLFLRQRKLDADPGALT